MWDGAPLSAGRVGRGEWVEGAEQKSWTHACKHTHTHTHTHTYHITAMASGVMTDAKKKGMYRREKAPNAVAPLNRHASKG